MRFLLVFLFAASALAQQTREVSVGYDYQDLPNGAWREANVALRYGALIGRVARAERFGVDDEQLDVEWYPKLAPKTYMFLSGGVSTESVLYPEWRAGAELYHGFGKGWEASGGYRRLEFEDGVDVYTASLGRYIGNWLLAGRIYDANETSWQATARRYYKDDGSYWGLRYGVARDDVRSGADLQTFDEPELAAEAFHVFPSRWTVRARAGVTGLGEDEGVTAALTIGRRY